MGRVLNFESQVTDEDFAHFREFWVELGEEEGQQENLVANVAEALNTAVESVRKSSYGRSNLSLELWMIRRGESG